MALMIGLFMGYNYNLACNFLWWIIGSVSFVGLYVLPSWAGYFCGLILAVYSMSTLIFMLDSFVANGNSPPIRSMTVFSLFFFIELLWNVWSVAYNFVPGGEVTRERSDVLIAFIMILLGFSIWRNKTVTRNSKSAGSVRDCGPIVRTLLLMSVLTGLFGFAFRINNVKMRDPAASRPETIRAAIFTCHFGFDNRGWSNAMRAVEFLENTDADVITLLESDTSKPFLGNNDLTAVVGEKLGMYTDFGASTRDHCWGTNLLSRFPIVYSEHHLLTSPHGEIAPAIRAGLDVGGGRIVDLVVTHMGIEETPLDRKLQAEELSVILNNSTDSAIFLGYITSKPFTRDYNKLTEQGRMKDIDTTDTDRWCEYILYRGLEKLGYARVTHGQLSDTELQMATFKLPPPGATSQQVAALNDLNPVVVTDPTGIPENIKFPETYVN